MIRIYGASDDLLEVEGDNPGCDEYNCFETGMRVTVGDGKGGLLVTAHYAPLETGTWRLAIDLIDEDVPIPWPVRIDAEGYSPIVIIECPAEVPVKVTKLRKGKRNA